MTALSKMILSGGNKNENARKYLKVLATRRTDFDAESPTNRISALAGQVPKKKVLGTKSEAIRRETKSEAIRRQTKSGSASADGRLRFRSSSARVGAGISGVGPVRNASRGFHTSTSVTLEVCPSVTPQKY